MTMHTSEVDTLPIEKKRELRKVIVSAAIGQFVEWYDFVVYAYSASTIAKLFFPDANPVAALLSTFAVYAIGFLMRIFGGVTFGMLGDRFGRRGVLALIIILMGASTFCIGLLPTYQSIGVLAPVLLVLCRLVQGLSAAGETTGSNSFVAEHAPVQRRGLYVAFTYSFANVAPVFAALFVLGITKYLTPDDYAAWGWRIPFLLGGPLTLIGMYIRAKVNESPAFLATKTAHTGSTQEPLLSTLKNNRRGLLFCFVMSALSSLGFYTLAGYFVIYLTTSTGLGKIDALIANSLALIVAFVTMNLGGYLSDRYGRKPILLLGIFASAVAVVPGYIIASHGTLTDAIIGQCLIAATSGLFWGPYPIAILELFPTRVRFSCAAISINVAYAIFGGTAPLISTWMINVSGNKLAPAFYTVAVLTIGLLIVTQIVETYRTSLLRDGDVD